MAQALYRKYRSKSLQEVVGQEHITDTLALALKNEVTSHAYLFTGPRGVGKTSVARIFAHDINKLPYSDDINHLDIIEIDAASNRRIDDVRDLRDKVHIAPTSALYKVYIIDEVHMLTGESFNALLKTLEEPPKHAVFILATTEVQKLPATIVSRVQRFHFRPVTKNKVIKHLQYIAKQEGATFEPEALSLIAEHGEGSFRDSISLLDQLSAMSGGNVTAAFVEQSLGLASTSKITEIIELLNSGSRSELHALLIALEEKGINPIVLSRQLISHFKAIAPSQPELYRLIDSLLEIHKSSQPSTKLLVTLLSHITPTSTPATTSDVPPRSAAIQATQPTVHVVQSSQPKYRTTRPSVTQSETSGKKTATEPATPTPPENTGPLLTNDHWPNLLEEVKRTNPPLFSLLKKAEPRFDGDNLTLAFSFKLHQIKLEDNRYRTKLIECIDSIGHKAPVLTVVHDAQASAPIISLDDTPTEPADEATASVLAMMGGGDMVNA